MAPMEGIHKYWEGAAMRRFQKELSILAQHIANTCTNTTRNSVISKLS